MPIGTRGHDHRLKDFQAPALLICALQLIQRLTQQTLGRIGLDSAVYTNTKPLIVTHGHQWDFWNCDRNNLVGKLFANSVGVPVDMLLDPFIDIGGVHGSGNVSLNFADCALDTDHDMMDFDIG